MLRPRGKKGTYYLKRRVPVQFASVHDSKFVELSLKTDSLEEAEKKAAALWHELEQGWQDKLDGRSDDGDKRFEAARKIAQTRGFRYRQMKELADEARLPDLIDRIEAIPVTARGVDEDVASALLGAVEPPRLTVSRALEKFWEFAASSKVGKSDDQIRRWENPKKKAVANFVKVVGDLDVADIRPDDMQDFQDWWLDRIETGAVTTGTANKDFTHLATVLRTVSKKMRLGIEPPVSGFTIKEGGRRSKVRPPYSDQFLREKLIPHFTGPDCRLNEEARDIILMLINTGARPSEIAGLKPETIHIDAKVPYISIEPIDRQIKNATSERIIPLVGVSLDAARRHPNGFPRYWDNPGLSAIANKYIRNNGLTESKDHVLYSLRHSFEDRLLAAQVDERVRRDLMGHSLGGRQRYGSGLPLADLRDVLLQASL